MSIAREIISFALKTGASDIHIEEGSPLALRVNSEIKISQQIINKENMDNLLTELLGDEKEQIEEKFKLQSPNRRFFRQIKVVKYPPSF